MPFERIVTHRSVLELQAPFYLLLTATLMINKPLDLLGLLTFDWKEEWAELGPSDPSYHHYEAVKERLDTVIPTSDIDRHLWLLNADIYKESATPPAETGFPRPSYAVRFILSVLKLMKLNPTSNTEIKNVLGRGFYRIGAEIEKKRTPCKSACSLHTVFNELI